MSPVTADSAINKRTLISYAPVVDFTDLSIFNFNPSNAKQIKKSFTYVALTADGGGRAHAGRPAEARSGRSCLRRCQGHDILGPHSPR